MAGHFIGDVDVRWLSNPGPDRVMELTAPFAYVDPSGKHWNVPSGAKIDGASIPQIFWTAFGPPFVGDYRRASVVHDHYCVTRTETDKETHRMFRDACRTGGVPAIKASAMYAAINLGGPHWAGPTMPEALGAPPFVVPQIRAASETDFFDIQKWIEETNPTLDEIDARIEQAGPLVAIPTS
ncbi:DUF1353 domain-containing protein [Oricola nitratireducens]|uniref:DUF1353 domain-containing protein n=1 Tax=Oricola nitratireducens TaxID=2775868 RepID=UPI001867FFBC|nr:DUF1353 domain-containing protein [Oricola nitratireducens]